MERPLRDEKKKGYEVVISRKIEITPDLVGLTISVHNGKSSVKVEVSENMIGYKAGEFVPTRSPFSFKKKK